MTDILVISDQHAHPDYNNNRADWLGQYIKDTKPDIVVNIGDGWDMPSISAYDKGKASFNGRSYQKDTEAGLDFQERLWGPTKKAKKKQPYRVFLHGNHENRLRKVLEQNPEYEGDKFGISFKNYQIRDYYHEEIPYDGGTPGKYSTCGITFAHFLVSGLMGRPIGGEHHAYSLISKHYSSCVVGHSHTVDFSVRTDVNGKQIMGLVCGVYQDYDSVWAGQTNQLWWRGLTLLKNVDAGQFDPEFISLEALRRQYS